MGKRDQLVKAGEERVAEDLVKYRYTNSLSPYTLVKAAEERVAEDPVKYRYTTSSLRPHTLVAEGLMH
jgi:hypothetical protein